MDLPRNPFNANWGALERILGSVPDPTPEKEETLSDVTLYIKDLNEQDILELVELASRLSFKYSLFVTPAEEELDEASDTELPAVVDEISDLKAP